MGAVRYGALNAQLKTRAAGLPTIQQYQTLLDAPNAPAVATLVKGWGMPVPDGGGRVSRLWLIARWLVPDYVTILQRTTGAGRGVVRCLLNRHELENVKYVVRAITAGAPVDPALLLDLGGLATVKTEALVRLREWSDLQAATARTVFAGPLGNVRGRLEEPGARVALEANLDRAVYAGLWKATRAFGGAGARQVAQLVAALLDVVSILWRVRYQCYYGVTAETDRGFAEAAPSLGKRRTDQRIPESLRVQLSAPSPGASPPIADLVSGWETSLWRSLNCAARRLLHGPPFAFSVAVGFLLDKEQAIQDVAWISEGVALGLSRDTLSQRLIHAPE